MGFRRQSIIKFCVYSFSLWYEFFVHYALRAEKIINLFFDAGSLEFQFLRARECLTNPFRALSLCFGVLAKHQVSSPVLILLKQFLSASAIAIMSWQDVARSSFNSSVKVCGTKRAHNFLFPKSSFRIRRTTILGMFKDSAIILDTIRPSFLTKSETAAMFT